MSTSDLARAAALSDCERQVIALRDALRDVLDNFPTRVDYDTGVRVWDYVAWKHNHAAILKTIRSTVTLEKPMG